MINSSLFLSVSAEHNTPPAVWAAAVACLGRVDLDPCSPGPGLCPVVSDSYYTIQDNGLAQPWVGRVYLNPPYGRQIGAWVNKLVDSYRAGTVIAAVALLPARTDTQWWQLLRDFPVCLIKGRLKFGDAANSAPFPSAIFYLGPDVWSFGSAFQPLGDVWVRIGGRS